MVKLLPLMKRTAIFQRKKCNAVFAHLTKALHQCLFLFLITELTFVVL